MACILDIYVLNLYERLYMVKEVKDTFFCILCFMSL